MENRLKEIRQKNNLTLKELGSKIGIPNNSLSQYENGRRQAKLEVWQKLADFFDVSVPYIQGFDEHRPNRIKKLRQLKKVSQGNLAKVTGLTNQAISQYENGKRNPNEKVWQQLADYFDVSVPYLKGEIDTEYLGKIIKTIYLVACNKRVVIKTKKESIIAENDRLIAITSLLLLMFKQLNLDHRSESREIFEKNASLLGLVGDEKVNYIKEASVSTTEENYMYDIECAKALIDFYDSL
ncbi:helix-turn-helix transcriptional regulator [Lactobacillus helsingborgensis]|uniref:helix-turn-helix transcriptional regulator n=1 Tax=Lactobacillus helsingborgensis TaxID=1218494 RepID=UPI002263B91D|nr:helix-turn-helix transcriptional regulator [Lactobacillus helsingborgensis]UZX30983.1 helix-turn-helix transcriptional regulator [Lactobacillus helsingborgensis]